MLRCDLQVVTRGRTIGGACVAVLVVVLAGCYNAGNTKPPQPAAQAINSASSGAGSGAFVVAENMLDTWNTIGKILVGLDGVNYEGRAQMLGLYSVRYRGEQFLIRTQAVVIGDASQGIHTRVDALGPSGKPMQSAVATALLGILAQRVPSEVAGYRQRIKLHPDKTPAKPGKTRKSGKH